MYEINPKAHKYLYIQYSVILIKIIKKYIKTNFIIYDTIILFNK